jgi:ribosome-associated protein
VRPATTMLSAMSAAPTSAMRIHRAAGGRMAGALAGLFTPRTLAPPWRIVTPMRDVPITGDMIRLGQLLKLADLAGGGGDIKAILADGVRVNGEVDERRGRQLHPGDIVEAAGESLRVVARPVA